jgi:hypothetical protein
MAARRVACTVVSGVGFAAGQYFIDLAHDDFLRITAIYIRIRLYRMRPY